MQVKERAENYEARLENATIQVLYIFYARLNLFWRL